MKLDKKFNTNTTQNSDTTFSTHRGALRMARAAKKAKTKSKKLYYRRATWVGQDNKSTLEVMLRIAHERFTTVGERTFAESGGLELRGADFNVSDGLYLQVACLHPDQATSTIEKDLKATKSKIDVQEPPAGKHYLDGDAFVLVKGNDLILCPSGAREGAVAKFIQRMLAKADNDEVANTLSLEKIANVSKVKMIETEGVKSISLNTSLYEASLLDLSKQNASGLMGGLAEQLKSLFAKDKDLKEISEHENLNIKIELTFDAAEAKSHKKIPKFGDAGKKRLCQTAASIIKEYEEDDGFDEGFVIVTNENNQIRPDEIRVYDNYKIQTQGKSLNRVDAWAKLKEYHERLKSDGVLSQ